MTPSAAVGRELTWPRAELSGGGGGRPPLFRRGTPMTGPSRFQTMLGLERSFGGCGFQHLHVEKGAREHGATRPKSPERDQHRAPRHAADSPPLGSCRGLQPHCFPTGRRGSLRGRLPCSFAHGYRTAGSSHHTGSPLPSAHLAATRGHLWSGLAWHVGSCSPHLRKGQRRCPGPRAGDRTSQAARSGLEGHGGSRPWTSHGDRAAGGEGSAAPGPLRMYGKQGWGSQQAPGPWPGPQQPLAGVDGWEAGPLGAGGCHAGPAGRTQSS